MSIEAIGDAGHEGLPLSAAVRAGDFLFVSGMVGFGPGGEIVPGGVGPETDRIIADLEALLHQAGVGLDRVVKVNVFLTDSADFEAFNRAYAKHFGDPKPARIGVVTDLTIGAKVEMDFTAYLGA